MTHLSDLETLQSEARLLAAKAARICPYFADLVHDAIGDAIKPAIAEQTEGLLDTGRLADLSSYLQRVT